MSYEVFFFGYQLLGQRPFTQLDHQLSFSYTRIFQPHPPHMLILHIFQTISSNLNPLKIFYQLDSFPALQAWVEWFQTFSSTSSTLKSIVFWVSIVFFGLQILIDSFIQCSLTPKSASIKDSKLYHGKVLSKATSFFSSTWFWTRINLAEQLLTVYIRTCSINVSDSLDTVRLCLLFSVLQ